MTSRKTSRQEHDDVTSSSSYTCRKCGEAFDAMVDEPRFMISCHKCAHFYHGDCIGMNKVEAKLYKKSNRSYICLNCCKKRKLSSDISSSQSVASTSATASAAPEIPPASRCKALVHNTRKQSVDVNRSNGNVNSTPNSIANLSNSNLTIPRNSSITVPISKANVHETSKTDSTSIDIDERKRVKNQLMESLETRLKNSDNNDLKKSLNKNGIYDLANSIEKEMYKTLSAVKYKSKFRSLIQNITMPNNDYLYKMILQKTYDPCYIVKMSTEDMASPDLAKWREDQKATYLKEIEHAQVEAEKNAKLCKQVKLTNKGEFQAKDDDDLSSLYCKKLCN